MNSGHPYLPPCRICSVVAAARPLLLRPSAALSQVSWEFPGETTPVPPAPASATAPAKASACAAAQGSNQGNQGSNNSSLRPSPAFVRAGAEEVGSNTASRSASPGMRVGTAAAQYGEGASSPNREAVKVWTSAVDQCCGPVLWTSVVDQCCGPVLWSSAVVQCCGPVLWTSVVDQCCGPVLCSSVVVQCCGPVLCSSAVVQCCGPVLWTSVVDQCCGEPHWTSLSTAPSALPSASPS